MKVEFHPQAQKEWQKLNPVTRARLAVKLDAYVADPDAFRNQVKKLKGMDALRFRVGDYRIVFKENGVVLRVLQVGHRRDVYR